MICKYCKHNVYFEPGFTENSLTGEPAHEECLQLSGDDMGAIQDMSDNSVLDFEVDFMLKKMFGDKA